MATFGRRPEGVAGAVEADSLPRRRLLDSAYSVYSACVAFACLESYEADCMLWRWPEIAQLP